MRGGRFAALAVCATLWMAAAGGWVGLLAVERVFMGDLSCPMSQDISEYGEATWSWFPPGVTCTWRDVSFRGSEHVVVEEPPIARLGIAGALLAWGGTIVALGWTTRPTHTARRAPADAGSTASGSEAAEVAGG